MTSPPKRPIISLKFKTPEAGKTEPLPAGTVEKSAAQGAKSFVPSKQVFIPTKPAAGAFGKSPEPTIRTVFGKPPVKSAKPARPAPSAAKTDQPAPPPAAAPPVAKQKSSKKSGPTIAPDLFKAAVKAAGGAIQNVVADPEWKNEELFLQYQDAKQRANATQKHQAKLVSTVATRRHVKNIEQADVESPAMRAAYAAALVALVGSPEEPSPTEPSAG